MNRQILKLKKEVLNYIKENHLYEKSTLIEYESQKFKQNLSLI